MSNYAYLDELETRSPQKREDDLLKELRALIKFARDNSTFHEQRLKDIDISTLVSRESLSCIPVTRKSDLKKIQAEALPFGGIATVKAGKLARVFSSPGPIYEPQPDKEDLWRLKRAMYAVGVRAGGLVYNTFSYHFTPAGFMVDEGARALGCAVFPAGVGQTELQAQTIAELKPDTYVGTPSFLKIILEKGDELGLDLSCLKAGIVGGEALLPATRKVFTDRKIDIKQFYGTADLGLIGYETIDDHGLVLDEEVLVEIVRPGSNEPVRDGEVGEVVVTVFSETYPLIRFGTGDLSMFIEGVSKCGRTNRRLKGWMGRADQTTKVKGMFIHPEQIESVRKRHPEITHVRLVVTHDDKSNDVMTLKCESESINGTLTEDLARSVRELTKLKAVIELCKPDSLKRDGIVIEDARKYD